VTDLRDQLGAFDAAARRPTCHPERRHKARGLCLGCYEHHMDAGTLDQFPRITRTPGDVIPRYATLRAAGRSRRYIARTLGITVEALNKHYYRAVAAGALTPDRRSA
jgi:hypothetical protein